MPDRRTVQHLEMDAFFASVEQRDHPELRDKPILIGHNGPRGVDVTASYEASPFGCCAIGSWGGRRLSLGGSVTGMGAQGLGSTSGA